MPQKRRRPGSWTGPEKKRPRRIGNWKKPGRRKRRPAAKRRRQKRCSFGWRQELPELKKELTAGKEEYETALKTGGLSEKEWKNLTETWSGEDAKKLQAGLDAWEKKKTAALSLQESAKKSGGGKGNAGA